jgi:hypothetical protein
MVILIEHRSHHHKTISLPNETCPLCQEKGKLKLLLMQKYQHVFGPMTPLPKYGVLECDACDQTIPNQKWNDNLDNIYKKEIAQIKTPARMWRGIWVLPLIFVSVIGVIKIASVFDSGRKSDYELEQIQMKKDILSINEKTILFGTSMELKTNEEAKTPFRVYKIEKIKGDTAFTSTYSNKGYQFNDRINLHISDLDNSKFSVTTIPTSLKIIKNEQKLTLIENANQKNTQGYGMISSIIKN